MKRPTNAKEPVNNENQSDTVSDDAAMKKLSKEHQQEQNTIISDNLPLQPKSTNTLPPHRLANHLAREKFYNGAMDIVVVPEQHTQQHEQANSIQSDETIAHEKLMETEDK